MRILEYQLQMTGGHYHLTNYPLAEDADDPGSSTQPGIHLIIEQCKDPQDFVESFCFTEEDDEKEYDPIKREVLLGENKDWILVTVDVSYNVIFLTYRNPEYTRQFSARLERTRRGEIVDDAPPPNDLFVVELMSRPNGGATLRFVTPRNDGSGYADTTLVKIPSSPKEYLVVTEFDGHKRRELTFLDSYSPEHDEYIWVKEFM